MTEKTDIRTALEPSEYLLFLTSTNRWSLYDYGLGHCRVVAKSEKQAFYLAYNKRQYSSREGIGIVSCSTKNLPESKLQNNSI